jgi:translation elongation factor P/translation initiation factor 5A
MDLSTYEEFKLENPEATDSLKNYQEFISFQVSSIQWWASYF